MDARTYNKIIFLFLFFLWSLPGFSQEKVNEKEEFLFNSASDFLNFQDYESAYELFVELDSIAPNNKMYTFKLGLCLFNSIDKVKSLLYFLKARQLGYEENEINYYLGLSYRYNYDLNSASIYLHEYVTHLSETEENYETKRSEAFQLIDQIESSKELLNQKLSVGVSNLGAEINSEYADYVPIVLSKDSVILFTSRREGSTGGKTSIDGGHYEDIYVSKMKNDGQWGKATHFPGFNSKHHDANVAINKDETKLYVFKANRHGDIYVSKKRNNGRWTSSKPLKGINSKYWEGSICLSPKEDTIYFSSDRPGGYGGSDIYLALRDAQGDWKNIQNLGPVINTPLDEDAPYLYKDGKTFFFSSKGHNSMGGYDVFSAKLIHGAWTDVKNIGFPINTVDDDIYFQLNSEASFGYFTSFRHSNFREKSIGEKDLFEITRPNSSPVYFVFKGMIYDERTKETIPAIVRLKDMVDTTQADQKLVADVNSGRFRYDLKFDNRYKLSVEVGDKVYFSRELYFPYQPDLFESFLDIPLKDVPTFNVKLADVLAHVKDTTSNVVLDNTKSSVVVLSRKVQYDDPELKDLLQNKKIPMSFRKRLMTQLKDTPYLDDPEEGDKKEIFSDVNEIESIYRSEDGLLKKLSTDDNNTIERFDVKNLLKEPSVSDSVIVKNLSPLEQRIVQRSIDYILGKDTSSLKLIDELYFKDLTPEETDRIFKYVAHEVQAKVSKDSLETAIDRLSNLVSNRGRIGSIKGFSKEAWGILYTIQASRFKFQEYERLGFSGKVTYRFNGVAAPDVKLLLADDRGMIYSQGITTINGKIRFTGLVPGRSYHILVNDYLISILGRSRYELNEPSILSEDEDYLKFYRSLSPEQRRSVDRIVADQLLKDNYQTNELHQWEDPAIYEKMNKSDKKFIDQMASYLSSTSAQDSSFYLDENVAYAYEQMTFDKRDLFNRLISRKATLNKKDIEFYEKLNETQKKYIDRMRDSRKAKKIITEDILLSKKDTDFWYAIDEIDTRLPGVKEVGVSGRLTVINKSCPDFEVALVDEFDQFIGVSRTDQNGEFVFPSVPANKKFKVLITNGQNIDRIADYKIVDLKIESYGDNFYETLSASEKKIIDRIIATNLANEYYLSDSTLMKQDSKFYNSLTAEEKEFIKRLRKNLFADSVTKDNLHLRKEDNHHYYNNLAWQERNFVNRYIVRSQYGLIKDSPFPLREKDKVFYDKLTERQKLFIKNLQKHRKANADIFAENPVLIIDKAWVVLDSINSVVKRKTADYLNVTGQLIDKETKLPAQGVSVMISDDQNNMMALVSTDSTGHFKVNRLSTSSNYYLLAESKRVFVFGKYRYELNDLNLQYFKNDTLQSDDVIVKRPLISRLVVHFDFDSHQINRVANETLMKWIRDNKDDLIEMQVIIEGHTDQTGKEEYNLALGERRAKSVKDFLIKNGLRTPLLKTLSFGETKPYYQKEQEELNRRVEIFVKE